MKTKQAKEESEKSIDEESVVEPKTRARKKATDPTEEDKTKPTQDDPKTSKEPKRNVGKPKAITKKKPLGIRKTKTLRGKKVPITATKKNVLRQKITRTRKAAVKAELDQEKETVPLIPASEIKKEPPEETTSNSRSSSPKTTGRRSRLSSDMVMMKSVLGDSPNNLVHGPRTSPYSMRSERSNSPSLFDGKNLRSGKPRKLKTNLLNEVVMKEQKKRRRLLSDAKPDSTENSEDCKKSKRGRSCSRDGSEISKCSDVTESDISLNEAPNDGETKELNKNLDKPKTDLDLDNETNVEISNMGKVPSNVDSKVTENKLDIELSSVPKEKVKKRMSLKRSTSLDSDNNNSNRVKLEHLNTSDLDDKSLFKTDGRLFEERSSILTCMSKTFNSKEVSKNIRKARRGRKAAAASRLGPNPPSKNGISSTITNDLTEDKPETVDSLSKEISDLINDLDQNIDRDQELTNDTFLVSDQAQVKPLGDNNSIVTPDTPIKDKEKSLTIPNECTPSKNDDSENIRLHYEEDSAEKCFENRSEITYKGSSVASIDKLMDRLKEFEEFDKRRQRQESESKSSENKSVMVTNDVVLIPKSGADIKPLKDIQTVRSPERVIEKENVLSCFFENNPAVSIVKRDQMRRSIEIDLPNSVTLIKRTVNSRKESTSSNHSRESDAISIFEKSLGKDVTLTEIRKSVEKPTPAPQIDLHQFATLHPNSPNQTVAGVVLDSRQISITPRNMDAKSSCNEVQIMKRKSSLTLSRKSSESGLEIETERLATLEKIKSPPHQMKSPAISITATPVAIKSPETQPVEAEALPPPIDTVKPIPEHITLASEVPKLDSISIDLGLPETSIDVHHTQTTPVADSIKVEEPKGKLEKDAIQKDEPMETEAITKTDAVDHAVPSAKITEPVSNSIPESVMTEEPIVEDPVLPKESLAKTESQAKAELVSNTESAKEEPFVKIQEVDKTVSKSELVANTETVTENVPVPKVEEIAPKYEISKPLEQKVSDIKLDETKEKSSKVKSARNSIENQPGPSNILQETPESQKRKENVLRTLGLLTHKAANEAKIEKLREKERIYGSNYSGIMGKGKSGKSDYTGTLKTIIKLNRGSGERDKKKYRSSLKMTFQKSKNRSGRPQLQVGEPGEGDAYYTIERREGGASAGSDGGHRKSHYSNRLNNHDTETVPEPEPKESLNLVIPEKASSFKFHPGRLCMDQCSYCGGKFGLYDTPSHIAQMKSSEKQRRVLHNEEKLTKDSCLCDACYRHVDRRANCPSYRKGPVGKLPAPPAEPHTADTSPSPGPHPHAVSPPQIIGPEKGEEEESEGEGEGEGEAGGAGGTCHTAGCTARADRCIRRKWLIKVRPSVNKILKLECDYPGLHTIPLCGEHHRALAPLMACALCGRRITKHHNLHVVHHGYLELNVLLAAARVPVAFRERPVLCKVCRYYCTLLQRPGHNDKHARAYTRKLLQIYNVEIPPELDQETDDTTILEDCNTIANKQKKRARTKSKQRKSTDPEKPESESSERTTESSPEKEKNTENRSENVPLDAIPIVNIVPKPTAPIEEDIESLISSNKIPVPGAKTTETNQQSDSSETDMISDIEATLTSIPLLDKQTELRYLLQKQNNPKQFQQKLNLTQKHKNSLKLQTVGIQKAGFQQRIQDKNVKRIQKIGQIITNKEKSKDSEYDFIDTDMPKEINVVQNISLNDECTIETIPNKKPADINTLKHKWKLSDSFTKVTKNLSELSKNKEKEPKKPDQKYTNPVKRLETNPSISVRELFPGEEEMNLQYNVEFNNVKGVTPEGWEKCNSTIQYDVETKKLWTELQRPYGNQSSFLRHLILLEKYFRSGDLVLSHNASPHAANYSSSVQSRLRAYDNKAPEPSKREAVSLIEFRKKPSMNGKSLLKSNQTDDGQKKFMPPPGVPKAKPKTDKKKALPPELIAINTPNAQGRKAIQNVLHNIQQLVKGVSASDPTEIAAAPLPPPKFEAPKEAKETPALQIEPIKDKPPAKPESKEKKEIKKDKKQKVNSKGWRPRLMPITPENVARIAQEPLRTSVDGHSLPSLVQVISSGTRYHITFEDYNKMCMIRKERQQRLQEKAAKIKKPTNEETTVVTEIQPSTMLGNGGTVLHNIAPEEKKDSELQISTNAANILKNVGLKNITIAPIPPKTATVTSQTLSPAVSSPSVLVTTPIKIPQFGPAVSITSETVLTPNLPIVSPSPMIFPKIPKSLTVIPQTVVTNPGIIVPVASTTPSQAAVSEQRP